MIKKNFTVAICVLLLGIIGSCQKEENLLNKEEKVQKSGAVVDSITVYPCANDEVISTVFSADVSGAQVPVVSFKDINYIFFAHNKKSITITITSSSNILSHSIKPMSAGISGIVNGKTLKFSMDKMKKLIVEINGKKLFVFPETPETDVPLLTDNGVVNIMSYKVNSTGSAKNTTVIQKAIDDLSSAGGGILYFPEGVYLSGLLEIKDNVKLYLAPGSKLLGSDDANDYPEFDVFNDKGKSTFIFFNNCSNAGIFGRGIIDGQGKLLRGNGGNCNLIRTQEASNITIEGVILRDPSRWNTRLHYSNNVTINDVKIINDLTNSNTDGINPDASQYVYVNNCFFYCGDDCIAVKATNGLGLLQNTHDIYYSNCVLWTIKSALKIGTETYCDSIYKVYFSNIDIIHADRAFYITTRDGSTVTDVHVDNVSTDYVGGDQSEMIFRFEVEQRDGLGKINNVNVSNWTSKNFSVNNSNMEGLDATHKVENITFLNLVIAGNKISNLTQGRFNTNVYTGNFKFEVLSSLRY